MNATEKASVTTALTKWVGRLRLRSHIGNDIVSALFDLPGRLHHFRTHENIERVGDVATDICLVVSGISGRYSLSPEGGRRIVALHLSGEVANLSAAVFSRPCYAQVAIGGTAIWRIAIGAFKELVYSDVRFMDACWRDVAVDAAIGERWLLTSGRYDAPARLAHLLCEIGLRYQVAGASRTVYPLTLTQEHLADVLGLTSVHVNRTIRLLRERGLVTWHNRVVCITDWEGLTTLGQFDTSYLHLPSNGLYQGFRNGFLTTFN